MTEVWRIAIKETQRIPILIAKQDRLVLGPEARDVYTAIAVEPGDVLIVMRPKKT